MSIKELFTDNNYSLIAYNLDVLNELTVDGNSITGNIAILEEDIDILKNKTQNQFANSNSTIFIGNISSNGIIDNSLIIPGYVKNNNIGLLSSVNTIPESDITNLITDLASKANLSGATFTGGITIPSLTIGTTLESFPLSGLLVGTTDSQTLTNKIISGSSNIISNIAESSVTNLVSDLTSLQNKTQNQSAVLGVTTFTGDILPNSSPANFYNLGSITAFWRNFYANSYFVGNLNGLSDPNNVYSVSLNPLGSAGAYGLGNSTFYWGDVYTSNIYPGVDNSFDLGTPATGRKYWRNIYVNSIIPRGNLTFGGLDFIPYTDNNCGLGESSLRWLNIYTYDVNIGSGAGSSLNSLILALQNKTQNLTAISGASTFSGTLTLSSLPSGYVKSSTGLLTSVTTIPSTDITGLTSTYVPYTGATGSVNLNSQNLTTTGTLSSGAHTCTTLNTTSSAVIGTTLTISGLTTGYVKDTAGLLSSVTTIPSTDINNTTLVPYNGSTSDTNLNAKNLTNVNNLSATSVSVPTINSTTGVSIQPSLNQPINLTTTGTGIIFVSTAASATMQASTAATIQSGSAPLALTSTGSNVNITSSTAKINVSATSLSPLTDNVMSLGDSSHAYTNVYTKDVNINGTSLNTTISGLVPYSGATTTINIGSQNLITTGTIQTNNMTCTSLSTSSTGVIGGTLTLTNGTINSPAGITITSNLGSGSFVANCGGYSFQTGGTNRLTLGSTSLTSSVGVTINNGPVDGSGDMLMLNCASGGANGCKIVMQPYTGGYGQLNMRADGTLYITNSNTTNSVKLNSTGFISATDNVYKPTAGSWLSSSDSKVKTNIQNNTHGLNEIIQLNPVTYQFNQYADVDSSLLGNTYYGLLADQVQPILPECVSNMPNTHFGNILALDVTPITYALINSIKTLNETCNSQAKTISNMQEQINSMNTTLGVIKSLLNIK